MKTSDLSRIKVSKDKSVETAQDKKPKTDGKREKRKG